MLPISFHIRAGSHFPQETLFRPLKPSELPMTTFAIEERINRKIPTPGGVTTIPPGVDEEVFKSLDQRKKENEEFPAASSGYVDPDSRKLVQPGRSRCRLRAGHLECFFPQVTPKAPPEHAQNMPRSIIGPGSTQTDPRPTPNLL